jgi:hypothetical protein
VFLSLVLCFCAQWPEAQAQACAHAQEAREVGSGSPDETSSPQASWTENSIQMV